MFAVLLLTALFDVILTVFLFKRAGIAGWKAFIPFYGSFLFHKMVFGEKAQWFWFLFFIVPGLYSLYVQYNLYRSFGRGVGFSVFGLFFPTVATLITVLAKDAYQGVQTHFLAS